MKRRDILLASLILIAVWQLLAMAIQRDTTTVVPTPLVVARTFVAVKMLHRCARKSCQECHSEGAKRPA